MDTSSAGRGFPCDAPGCRERGAWAYAGGHRLGAAHRAAQQAHNAERGLPAAACTLAGGTTPAAERLGDARPSRQP